MFFCVRFLSPVVSRYRHPAIVLSQRMAKLKSRLIFAKSFSSSRSALRICGSEKSAQHETSIQLRCRLLLIASPLVFLTMTKKSTRRWRAGKGVEVEAGGGWKKRRRKIDISTERSAEKAKKGGAGGILIVQCSPAKRGRKKRNVFKKRCDKKWKFMFV